MPVMCPGSTLLLRGVTKQASHHGDGVGSGWQQLARSQILV